MLSDPGPVNASIGEALPTLSDPGPVNASIGEALPTLSDPGPVNASIGEALPTPRVVACTVYPPPSVKKTQRLAAGSFPTPPEDIHNITRRALKLSKDVSRFPDDFSKIPRICPDDFPKISHIFPIDFQNMSKCFQTIPHR